MAGSLLDSVWFAARPMHPDGEVRTRGEPDKTDMAAITLMRLNGPRCAAPTRDRSAVNFQKQLDENTPEQRLRMARNKSRIIMRQVDNSPS